MTKQKIYDISYINICIIYIYVYDICTRIKKLIHKLFRYGRKTCINNINIKL